MHASEMNPRQIVYKRAQAPFSAYFAVIALTNVYA